MNLSFDLPESVVHEAVREAWARVFAAPYCKGRELVTQHVAAAVESREMRDTIARLVAEQAEVIAKRVVAEELEKHLRKQARKAAKNVTLPAGPNLFTP